MRYGGLTERQTEKLIYDLQFSYTVDNIPVDNFGTVVGENPTPYRILALWVVNGLSIIYWDIRPANKFVGFFQGQSEM